MQTATPSSTTAHPPSETHRYAKCIEVSKRIRWDIDRDVIRGRSFDFNRKFLPDGLSKVAELSFLDDEHRRLLSQVQGRTYVNMFGMIERYIGAKMLEISRDHWFGDQVALEALVRFTDEELKHQELFRRLEEMMAPGMPAGYRFMLRPNEVAAAVLGKSTWAVLALTCHIELFTQAHYRQSIEPDPQLSDLWKDVFLFHFKEESQHAIVDELEWVREDARITAAERDRGVDDLIALVTAIDGMLVAQAADDASYFVQIAPGPFDAAQAKAIEACLLRAYRWQYIVSGVQVDRFQQVLGSMITPAQFERIGTALAPLMATLVH
ncbi:hypothetical protein [Piscinibacter sp. XHJ-5]|uniref:hypothetical protein n=1 Tax=Piscinibacter sp. XHJ-5 TaxID=3037797 RepID=UPI002452A4EF|nr:hypothetical protein [Piscinibacter sp. XHJ-5]